MPSILESIRVGSVLQFVAPMGFVVPKFFQAKHITILCVDYYPMDFTVSWYEFNGGDEAKISLRQSGDFGFWAVGRPDAGGLKNPIIIAPTEDRFVITDRGAEKFSIKNIFAPPAPFIKPVETSEGTILSYGFDSPEPDGLFNILLLQQSESNPSA
ncbi:MAG: hypothetical protein ICV60_04795 [Pyrinomonadaceae bacterium]|nr:hypothetical protein [Pyrinomonadaceae bacterium]